MKYNRNVYQALMMISQFGINVLVPVFLCSFIGMAIDRKSGTSFWVVIMFFVGAIVGFRNVYKFAKKIYEVPSETRKRRKTNQEVDEHGEKLEEKN